LHVVDDQAWLEVSDNGLGIPEAEQQALFTRFFRSSTALVNAIQGSGLGLTIVDSIVKTHGGEISVVSRHRFGSTFTVTLPMINV
jgi:signal transduction histidine kinase